MSVARQSKFSLDSEFDVDQDAGLVADALQSVSEMLKQKPVEYQKHLLLEIERRLMQKSLTPTSAIDHNLQALIRYTSEIKGNFITKDGEQKNQLIKKIATINVMAQYKNRFASFSEIITKAKLIADIIEAVQADAAVAEWTLLNSIAEKIASCLINTEDDESKKQLQELLSQLVKVQSLAHNTKTLSVACRELKADTEQAKKAHIISALIKIREKDLAAGMQEPLLNILAGIAVLGLIYPDYMSDTEKADFEKNFPAFINDQTLDQNLDTLELVYAYSNPDFHPSLEEFQAVIRSAKLNATDHYLLLLNDLMKKTIIGLFYPGQHTSNSKEYDALVRALEASRMPKDRAVAKAVRKYHLVLGATLILGVATGGLILGPWMAFGAISTACKLIAGILGMASVACSVTACCFFSTKKAATNINADALGLYNKTHNLDPIIKRDQGLFLR